MASDKLDDLLLLEKLAAGGMAEVYRALQQGYGGFEKIVAVKRILPHFASDEEFKNMFVMEAQLSGLMQHPNVVQIFSNGEAEGYLYLVMEFVDGKNLRQLLARADKQKVRIPIEDACFVIAEAAKGLEYAHSFIDQKTGQSMEIVHRDMSPQNIMLSYDGGIKIVDFGIAKAAARSEHTRAGVLKGKFGYMSPEQAQGMPIDCRTDIFALGIIFFELLTQRRLFSHDDDMRTLQLIRECNVPRPSKYNPSISPALDRIVLKALAKNRGDRYATAGDFYADLQRFMNQKYPQFLPMDFAKFLKTKIFQEDIKNEKAKREALAAEAPARLSEAKSARKVSMPQSSAAAPDKDATKLDFSTEISDITNLSDAASPGSARRPEAASPQVEAAPVKELEKTRLSNASEVESELPAPSPPAGEALSEIEDPDNSAFPMRGGPSHLSLSMTVGDKGPPLSVRKPALSRPQSSSRSLDIESDPGAPSPGGRVNARDISYAQENAAGRRIFGTRLYVALMSLAGLGAYWHLKAKPPSSFSATVAQGTQIDPSVTPTQVTTLQASPAPPPETHEAMTDRRPAAVAPYALDAPAYASQGATGYLNVKTFPAANEVLIDGRVLVDESGAPVRAPANLQKVEVGPRRVVVRNKSLGLSWEGQVEIEFDRVKTLEVRLK